MLNQNYHLVTCGYAEWHNMQEKQKRHVSNSYHTDAMVKALEINDKFEKPVNTIEYQTHKGIQKRQNIPTIGRNSCKDCTVTWKTGTCIQRDIAKV